MCPTWRSIMARTRSTAAASSPPRRISSRPARIGASGLRSSWASDGEELVLAAVGVAQALLALAQRLLAALAIGDVAHEPREPDAAAGLAFEGGARGDRQPPRRAVGPAHADVLAKLAGAGRVERARARRREARPVVGGDHGPDGVGDRHARVRQAEQLQRPGVRLATPIGDVPDEASHLGGVQCELQARLAVAQLGLGGADRGEIVEVADDAEGAVRQRDALDLPVVRSTRSRSWRVSVRRGATYGSPVARVWRKRRQRLAHERLGPERAQHLAEVPADERLDAAERRRGAVVHRVEAEVGVDDVDAEGRVLDERGEGLLAAPASRLGLAAIGDVVGDDERGVDAARAVVQRHRARQVGAAVGVVLVGADLSREREPAMRLDAGGEHRVEDVVDAAADEVGWLSGRRPAGRRLRRRGSGESWSTTKAAPPARWARTAAPRGSAGAPRLSSAPRDAGRPSPPCGMTCERSGLVPMRACDEDADCSSDRGVRRGQPRSRRRLAARRSATKARWASARAAASGAGRNRRRVHGHEHGGARRVREGPSTAILGDLDAGPEQRAGCDRAKRRRPRARSRRARASAEIWQARISLVFGRSWRRRLPRSVHLKCLTALVR